MTVDVGERLLDDELVQRFERDGFVVVPDLLDLDELDRYETLVTAGVTQRNAGDTTPLEEALAAAKAGPAEAAA